MYCVKKVTDDLFWVGGNDRRLELFENAFPISRGVSYNSYILMDEKTVCFDTVDKAVSNLFIENIEHVLDGRNLDYLIVNHMEPDHCATIERLVQKYSELQIVCNAKTVDIIKQFFDFDVVSRAHIVSEGDTFSSGRHELTFISAPMVHWPEVMVTYDKTDKILFSADAFGTFGTIDGSIFADDYDFENEWLSDARRYYTNIVGKYGTQVKMLLNKAKGIDISMVCPLHGLVWRKNIEWYVDKYMKWASYEPEEKGVVIAFASVYGHTENSVDILAGQLADRGIKNIKIYDVSKTDGSVILSECFKYSHLVFASITYNGGIFSKMENLLHDLKAHNLQNRTVALIENGTWAVTCGKQMADIISSCRNMTILENKLSIKSEMKQNQLEQSEKLADEISKTM